MPHCDAIVIGTGQAGPSLAARLAGAGMTEDQVRESGRRALRAKRPMTTVGRAKEEGETRGFMKIIVDGETKEILGVCRQRNVDAWVGS